ncbi:YceD family protein [Haloplasma contractile]|uniref:ACR protein n=1 Tax=Haloplasma contractile SSD-17B TaxID=1033810 RepID=U2EG25_9MOLU|nr:YceD family protein [Haloplasma contractile]ERJ13566.1 putative ACR protein [Haloplasma contractile SSD-17B]
MKWTIAQLKKLGRDPFEVNETVNYSDIAKQHHDIRKISDVTITGTGQVMRESVMFNLNIQCELTLGCALTLEDVKYPINIDTQEIFSWDENADDENEDIVVVKGLTVEIAPIIWQNIVLNIPIRVVAEGAHERMKRKGSDWQIVDENESLEKQEKIDPRFAVLKNLFKDEDKEDQ